MMFSPLICCVRIICIIPKSNESPRTENPAFLPIEIRSDKQIEALSQLRDGVEEEIRKKERNGVPEEFYAELSLKSRILERLIEADTGSVIDVLSLRMQLSERMAADFNSEVFASTVAEVRELLAKNLDQKAA